MAIGTILYIRKKPEWVNILRDAQELDMFMDSLTPGKEVVIGDVAQFNAGMRNRLLKIIEDNEGISLYASVDLDDPVLLSRVFKVVKDPVVLVKNGIELELYEDSPKDFQSVASNLSALRSSLQLRACKLPVRLINLIVGQNK